MAGETPRVARGPAPYEREGDGNLLTQVHRNSLESLELLRSLIQLLLPIAEPRTGPTLEELLAALIAMQRDQMILLRQIAADVGTLHGRLPGMDEGERSPARAPNGLHHA